MAGENLKARNEAIFDAWQAGVPVCKIASRVGLASSTVKHLLRRERRERGLAPETLSDDERKKREREIYISHTYGGETFASISRRHGISGTRVRQIWHRMERQQRRLRDKYRLNLKVHKRVKGFAEDEYGVTFTSTPETVFAEDA